MINWQKKKVEEVYLEIAQVTLRLDESDPETPQDTTVSHSDTTCASF